MSVLSDEHIVLKIQKGESKLFSELIHRYEPKMKRYARKSIRNTHDVDDVVQDVFIRVYTNINNFDPERKFSSWIYRIAHNTFLNHIRAAKKEFFRIDFDTVLPFLFGSENPEEIYSKKELAKVLNGRMETLSQKYKDILILRFQEELSYEEIADVLRIPVSTVGVRISRALSYIKKTYEI